MSDEGGKTRERGGWEARKAAKEIEMGQRPSGECCSLLRIYKWEGKHFKRWERYAKYMYVCAIATGV